MGDFNSETTGKHMEHFCDNYHFKNLVKNPNIPSCFDLFLTSCSKKFQDAQAVEIGLSDFGKMKIAALTTFYTKHKHNIVLCKNYKMFVCL